MFPICRWNKRYDEFEMENCILRTNDKDCWFLTKDLKIVKLISISPEKVLYGQQLKELRDFYTSPLRSSHLYIFESNNVLDELQSYTFEDFKAKLFCIKKSDDVFVFFPLLHTFNEN